MNNSLISPKPETAKEMAEEREAKIVRLLEAVGQIRESSAWSTLKTEEFDSLTTRIRQDLLREAKNDNPNTNKLNRLAGELKWAERFSDLDKYEKALRVELQGVRMRIHGTKE